MLLENLLPTLPSNQLELLIVTVGAAGAILVIYSQFVEAEHRRDLIRMIGAGGLTVYALSLMNLIIILASFGIFAAAFVEFLEIYLGVHKHTRADMLEYFRSKK